MTKYDTSFPTAAGEGRRGASREAEEGAKGEKGRKKANFSRKMVNFAHNRVIFRPAGGGEGAAGDLARGRVESAYIAYISGSSSKKVVQVIKVIKVVKGQRMETWKIDIIKAKFA